MKPIASNLEMVFGAKLAEDLYASTGIGDPATWKAFPQNGNIKEFIDNIESLRFCNKPEEVAQVVVHTLIGMSQQIDKLTEQVLSNERLRVTPKPFGRL